MFRIKNTRNATVAKPALPRPPPRPPLPSLPPSPLVQPLKQPPAGPHRQAGGQAKLRPLPPRQLLRKSENVKSKAPMDQHRMITTKPHRDAALAEKTALDKKQEEKPKEIERMAAGGKEGEQVKTAHLAVDSLPAALKSGKEQSQGISFQKQTFQQGTSQKQRCAQQLREQEEYSQMQQLISKEREEKEREEEKMATKRQEEEETKLRVRRREEEEQEAKREMKMRETMEQVEARRKARLEEKERRLQLEKEVERQRIGGMVVLSDPLAHVEMSEAAMDGQVSLLLSMRFAGFPNREALERQVEELERINRSYLLVRTDPANPLIRGLASFRVELFNRVGELVAQGQAELGPAASGLQMVQADSRNYPQLRGVQVTRGLEGHLSTLKKSLLRTAEECAICLSEVEAGRSVYDVTCGHKFHEKCLEDWLNTSANCPACRYNIKFDHP